MDEDINVMKLFKGLTPQQARRLSKEIVMELPKLREKILRGETISREPDTEEETHLYVPLKMGAFRGWKEGDGLVKYHFRDMPSGYQCAWSCNWLTKEGRVSPLDWGANPEIMTPRELAAELLDTAQNPEINGYIKSKAAEFVLGYFLGTLQEYGLVQARGFLQNTARLFYKDYVAPGNPQERGIMMRADRPGWPVAQYHVGNHIFN